MSIHKNYKNDHPNSNRGKDEYRQGKERRSYGQGSTKSAFRANKDERPMGYYVLLDLEPFVTNSGLPPHTHPLLVPITLERKWVWSPYDPAHMVCTFTPNNVRHIVDLLPDVKPSDQREDEQPINGNEEGSDGDKLVKQESDSEHDSEGENKSPARDSMIKADDKGDTIKEMTEYVQPEAICIIPPKYVFSKIPVNVRLLHNVNIMVAEVICVVEGPAPRSANEILPFNAYQICNGVADEAKTLGINLDNNKPYAV